MNSSACGGQSASLPPNRLSRPRLRVVTALLLSGLLSWSCCASKAAPVIVGKAQILSVDPAGNVLMTGALYRRMIAQLRRCQPKHATSD